MGVRLAKGLLIHTDMSAKAGKEKDDFVFSYEALQKRQGGLFPGELC